MHVFGLASMYMFVTGSPRQNEISDRLPISEVESVKEVTYNAAFFVFQLSSFLLAIKPNSKINIRRKICGEGKQCLKF